MGSINTVLHNNEYHLLVTSVGQKQLPRPYFPLYVSDLQLSLQVPAASDQKKKTAG
jgi:hypothetical protein